MGTQTVVCMHAVLVACMQVFAHRAQLLELVCEDGVHDGKLSSLVDVVGVAADRLVLLLVRHGRVHTDRAQGKSAYTHRHTPLGVICGLK